MKRLTKALALAVVLATGNVAVAQVYDNVAPPVAEIVAENDTAGIEAFSDTTSADSQVVPVQTSYTVNMDADSMGQIFDSMQWIGTGFLMSVMVILLLFVLAPLLIIVLLCYLLYKNRKQKRMLEEMAMNGVRPMPGSMARRQSEPEEAIRRKGTRCILIGVVMMPLSWLIDVTLLAAIGVIITLYGIWEVMTSRSLAKKRQRERDLGDGRDDVAR